MQKWLMVIIVLFGTFFFFSTPTSLRFDFISIPTFINFSLAMRIQTCRILKEAMCGGLTGFGCDDPKLIAALCSRTKSQLRRTATKFRELFDKDLRATVRSEAGGDYGRMMDYALATPEDYVADMIDLACSGMVRHETIIPPPHMCFLQTTLAFSVGKKDPCDLLCRCIYIHTYMK
jgi:hypothetical protein